MREIIREIYLNIRPHYHIAIIAHNPSATHLELKEDIINILSQKNILSFKDNVNN